MKSTLAAFTLLLTTALASPLTKRAPQVFCGQYDTTVAGPYTLFTNLWGRDGFQGGQCATLNSISGSNIAWSTNWTWTGGPYQVKSYSNVGLNMDNKQISTLKSIPTTWDWQQTGSGLVADVSYDLFSSAQKDAGSADYEIMVWLAAIGGAGPISSNGSPVATPTLAGTKWNLFSGMNGNTKVLSFVAQSQVTNFNADLLDFIKYLEQNQGYSAQQWLRSVQAGTEPFTGSGAVLTTSKYSVALN